MGDKRKMKKENIITLTENDIHTAYNKLLVKYAVLEKENAELKEEVKEWKDKADLWCNTANLKDHNIMINKELEKENAELKEQNRNLLESCEGATIMYEHLTKAKELLREIIDTPVFNQMGGELYENEGYTELVEETEQFLNSEVEK
jgi:uncharacterized phage-like protein YoqJ